jgi:hypothetical protein
MAEQKSILSAALERLADGLLRLRMLFLIVQAISVLPLCRDYRMELPF